MRNYSGYQKASLKAIFVNNLITSRKSNYCTPTPGQIRWKQLRIRTMFLYIAFTVPCTTSNHNYFEICCSFSWNSCNLMKGLHQQPHSGYKALLCSAWLYRTVEETEQLAAISGKQSLLTLSACYLLYQWWSGRSSWKPKATRQPSKQRSVGRVVCM